MNTFLANFQTYHSDFFLSFACAQDRYPGLQVEGGNFPPPPLRSVTAQTLSALKFILIIVLVSGQNPFALLNVATPEAYNWAIENKVYACMMVFFVSNMIETQLVSTGECWINIVVTNKTGITGISQSDWFYLC